MTARETVKLNYPVKIDDINGPISRNIKLRLESLKTAYNAQQGAYPEERATRTFNIERYGYEITSYNIGYKKNGIGATNVLIDFRVRPMPYAFDDASDLGINEQACSAIAADIKRAFLLPDFWPSEQTDDAVNASYDKLREFIVNHGRQEKLDTTKFSVSLNVHLDRFTGYSLSKPKTTCSINLNSATDQHF